MFTMLARITINTQRIAPIHIGLNTHTQLMLMKDNSFNKTNTNVKSNVKLIYRLSSSTDSLPAKNAPKTKNKSHKSSIFIPVATHAISVRTAIIKNIVAILLPFSIIIIPSKNANKPNNTTNIVIYSPSI